MSNDYKKLFHSRNVIIKKMSNRLVLSSVEGLIDWTIYTYSD